MIILAFGIVLASAPEPRLFGLDTQTFIQVGANLVNVAILAVILALVLYKPVRNFLRKRTDKIQGQLSQAADEMEKAAELRTQYEQKIEEVQREREEILSEARKLASDTSQRLVTEAKKEADAIRARATANVEMEWERAETDMRTAIIEISSVMAEKFVTLAINKETHDKLFDETIADLGGMIWRD